mmetsp:Transcript_2456/g.3619  ORF Transcript_2456/g.3619 Transcript_2456/m.3619 type:complete len:80 (-) Transcript_2456:123-362(-)
MKESKICTKYFKQYHFFFTMILELDLSIQLGFIFKAGLWNTSGPPILHSFDLYKMRLPLGHPTYPGALKLCFLLLQEAA